MIRPSTDPVRIALERDLIEWADDVSLRLVWADLLQIDGDPLGRLIVLDHLAESRPSVRHEADALRASLVDVLDPPDDPEFTLRWERGFVRTLEVRPRQDPWRTAVRCSDALARPALRFLESLHVTVDDGEADPWPQAILRAASHSTLRELHVGNPPRLELRPAGDWESGRPARRTHTGHASLGKFPRLRRMTVAGELARLPCQDGAAETRRHHVLSLARRPATSRNRTSLLRALWDPSTLVQTAAFQTIGALGRQADYLVEELELVLRPPFAGSDPRQAQAMHALGAIGPASAELLPPMLVDSTMTLIGGSEQRMLGLLDWIRGLGRVGTPALAWVDGLLASAPKQIPSSVRQAAKSARKAIG